MKKENLKRFYHFTIGVGIAFLVLSVMFLCILIFKRGLFGRIVRISLVGIAAFLVIYCLTSLLISFIRFQNMKNGKKHLKNKTKKANI